MAASPPPRTHAQTHKLVILFCRPWLPSGAPRVEEATAIRFAWVSRCLIHASGAWTRFLRPLLRFLDVVVYVVIVDLPRERVITPPLRPSTRVRLRNRRTAWVGSRPRSCVNMEKEKEQEAPCSRRSFPRKDLATVVRACAARQKRGNEAVMRWKYSARASSRENFQ